MNIKFRTKEMCRWLGSPLFAVTVLLCTWFHFMDIQSSQSVISELKAGSLFSSAVTYFAYKDGFLWLAGLCLMTLTGATLYASDFEQNAVYMRIQRMGKKRYVYSRIWQTAVTSFLCGALSFLLCLVIMSCYYHIDILPEAGENVAWFSRSTLLQAGKGKLYIIMKMIQSGFCYLYYAMLTMLVSFFIPKRKVVIAMPMIFWYFNQYVFAVLDFVPNFLKPSLLFANDVSPEEMSGFSDGWGLLVLTITMIIVVLFTAVVFYLRLGRQGIFGGEEEC
jgi:hypothetical protein